MEKSVHILMPSYDGSCHILTAWGITTEILVLQSMGIKATWDVYPGCCYPEIARNMLCKKFLENNYTDALFIDTDVTFEGGAIAKILRHDVDVVAGIYPYKVDEESYPVVYDITEDGRPWVDSNTGLIKGIRLPTGFMRIRRNVFEQFIEEVGEQILVEDLRNADDPVHYYSFFDTPKIGKTKWGEDFHFCNAWRGLGGEVWIDPDITFWHHGLKSFKGNFHEYLRKLPGGGGPPEEDWNFEPRIP